MTLHNANKESLMKLADAARRAAEKVEGGCELYQGGLQDVDNPDCYCGIGLLMNEAGFPKKEGLLCYPSWAWPLSQFATGNNSPLSERTTEIRYAQPLPEDENMFFMEKATGDIWRANDRNDRPGVVKALHHFANLMDIAGL